MADRSPTAANGVLRLAEKVRHWATAANGVAPPTHSRNDVTDDVNLSYGQWGARSSATPAFERRRGPMRNAHTHTSARPLARPPAPPPPTTTMATALTVLAMLALALSSAARADDPCASLAGPQACLTHPALPGCGWCGDDGSCRSGPGQCTPARWLHLESRVNATLATSDELAPLLQRVFLRPGQPLMVPVVVQPPPLKPVDVYLLMDFTGSMNIDLATVQSLAGSIGQAVYGLCNDRSQPVDLVNQQCARLGMGSYKEIPAYPAGQWDTDQLWLRNSSTVPSNDYVFRAPLPLGTNLQTFVTLVQGLGGISSNVDPPEDPFGALVQALMCDQMVGWSAFAGPTQPRRIVIIVTDIDFHLRVEGIRSGQFDPARLECWADQGASSQADVDFSLDSKSIKYDYPSLQLVKDALVQTGAVPIFAVPFDGTNERAYNDVVNYLGFGYVSPITSDASNIVESLQSAYTTVAGTLTASATQTSCQQFVQSVSPSNYSSVQTSQSYTFNITLFTNGTQVPTNGMQVNISLPGFGTTTIVIDTVPDLSNCSSFCTDDAGNPKCGPNGVCTCGQCACASGWAGLTCNCSTSSSLCPSANGAVCSGNGECQCGQCVCYSNYTGSACSCPVGGCPADLTTGVVCSGNGVCDCGRCTCDAGWNGLDCSCPQNSTSCYAPNSTVACSGNGTCLLVGACQVCRCAPGYSGTFCDILNLPCPSNCNGNGVCANGVCQCNAGWSGDLCDCPTNSSLCGNPPCGGHGTCSCGQCTCNAGWTGAECACYTLCEVVGTAGVCAGHGTCGCDGQCQCDNGWLPPYCECAANATCPLGTGGLLCSGLGTCVCGECQCASGYSGPNCSCADVACSTDCGLSLGQGQCSCGSCICAAPFLASTNCLCNASTPCPTSVPGQPCSGNGQCLHQLNPSTGELQCGVCQCSTAQGVPQWTGSDCSCSTAPCYVDASGNTCSGHGTCLCGQCNCTDGWQGSQCNCAPCTGISCGAFGSCVCGLCECDATSGYYGSQCQYCDETVPGNQCPSDPCRNFTDCNSCAGATYGCGWCSIGGGCFNISLVDNYCSQSVGDAGSCAFLGALTKTQTAAVFGGSIAGLVIVGVLIVVIVKGALMARDKREWMRFEREKESSRWKADVNPLFKSNAVEYNNPLYAAPAATSS